MASCSTGRSLWLSAWLNTVPANVTNQTTKSWFGSCPGEPHRICRPITSVYPACQPFLRGAGTRVRVRTPVRTWAVERTARGARQEATAKDPSSALPSWAAGSDQSSSCRSLQMCVSWVLSGQRWSTCFRANLCFSFCTVCRTGTGDHEVPVLIQLLSVSLLKHILVMQNWELQYLGSLTAMHLNVFMFVSSLGTFQKNSEAQERQKEGGKSVMRYTHCQNS